MRHSECGVRNEGGQGQKESLKDRTRAFALQRPAEEPVAIALSSINTAR